VQNAQNAALFFGTEIERILKIGMLLSGEYDIILVAARSNIHAARVKEPL
jgi:hypothetical protein